MCFGGGDDQYNAYNSGDFARWKGTFDKKAAIQQKAARGELTKQQADAQLAALAKDPTSAEAFENYVKQDASANMEMRELQRQNDVSIGRIGVDKSFKQFDDGYYDKYKKSYTDYYTPELDRQYDRVVGKTVASLADRGVLESSTANDSLADLARENTDARTGIANEAVDAAKKLRGQVENSKSNLYSLNEASANPQAVNAQAVGSATSLVAPPTYSPLGQVFASALNSLGSFQSARSNRPTRSYSSPYPQASGAGSSTVVR